MTGGDCSICGKGEAHTHIISNSLPPGGHPSYEELVAENKRIHRVKDMVLRERQTMETRCRELSKDVDDLKRWNRELNESLIAILHCASEGGPASLAAILGLIRIECNRVLGSPGAQAAVKLSDTIFSTDELMDQLKEYMNKHTNATGSGPCCPPGQCKEGIDPLECSRRKNE